MTRLKLVNSRKASVKKIIGLELWRGHAQAKLKWSVGGFRLRLINFLGACMLGTSTIRLRGGGPIASTMARLKLFKSRNAFMKQTIDLELWRAQAQTCQFP